MLPGIKQFDLSGRTVLVTGGSKGLGKAMADGFASAGANLFLVSRNLDEATAAADLFDKKQAEQFLSSFALLEVPEEETDTE